MDKRKLRLSRLITILLLFCSFAFFVVRGVGALISMTTHNRVLEFIPDVYKSDDYETLEGRSAEPVSGSEDTEFFPHYETAMAIGNDIESDNVILASVSENRVVAERGSTERMYPASMTKIMTLLVASESIPDLNQTFTMTYEITDPLYTQNATVMGLLSGETVPVTDLFYGAILPSGADATAALAIIAAGSEENFVELMNEKAASLGLLDTHFMNTSGLHHEEHYTTAYDMALILNAAMNNELCRTVLTTEFYRTASTPEHPDGLELYSTMYQKKIRRDSIDGVVILGGKTGYTYEAGYCLASIAEKNGRTYIAVTGGGDNKNSPKFDVEALYSEYI